MFVDRNFYVWCQYLLPEGKDWIKEYEEKIEQAAGEYDRAFSSHGQRDVFWMNRTRDEANALVRALYPLTKQIQVRCGAKYDRPEKKSP